MWRDPIGSPPLPPLSGVSCLFKSKLDWLGVTGGDSGKPVSLEGPVNTQRSFIRERFVRVRDERSLNPWMSKAPSRAKICCSESVAKVSSWNPTRTTQYGKLSDLDVERRTFIAL